MSTAKQNALSILMVVGLALSAPYLVPVSADLPVYRSSVYTGFLLLATFFPIRHVLQHYQLPKPGFFRFAFFFSLALSLGTELATCNGFTPGAFAMVRRILVPFLSTSAIACLLLFFFSLSLADLPQARPCSPLPFAGILLLCWFPVFLAYFPGMLNYDFYTEYSQHLSGVYSSIHPLLHSILMNSIVTLGEKLHSRTLGLGMMSVLQMLLFASVLGHACSLLTQHGVPRLLVLLCLLLFGFHPVFSVMALSMTKDTLFAASLVELCLLGSELTSSPKHFFSSLLRPVLFIVSFAGTLLLRNNGIFAVLPMLLYLLFHIKQKKFVFLSAVSVASTLALLAVLHAVLTPESLPSFQLYSLPAQQMVRAYHFSDLTQEEKSELESWYTSPEGLKLNPHLADPAKGYLDRERLNLEGNEFLSLWLRLAPKSCKEYIEAFLMLNTGSWYPDDRSHATIYPDVSYNDKGYLQTQEYNMTEEGFHTTSFLPPLTLFLERVCRRNRYLKVPLLSILFCPAVAFWGVMLGCFFLRQKGQISFAPAKAAMLGLFFSYLLGPCTLPRYMLPFFCMAPLLILLSLTAETR